VNSLHTADCATVIVSEDQSAGITIQASANWPLGAIPLASASASIQATATRGTMVQVIASRNIRPLYRCVHVKTGWFTDPTVEVVNKAIVGPMPFEPLDVNVLVNS
jgi:hypothetical protein